MNSKLAGASLLEKVELSDTLVAAILGLSVFLIFIFGVNLNRFLWNPMIWGSIRTVEDQDVHKLGTNRFVYLTEVRPFSGESVKYLNDQKTGLDTRRLFVHGMLHTKTTYHPETGHKIIEIFYQNEKVILVKFYAADGSFVASVKDDQSILRQVKSLNYLGYYSSQVM